MGFPDDPIGPDRSLRESFSIFEGAFMAGRLKDA
jgi:hypothetical protein